MLRMSITPAFSRFTNYYGDRKFPNERMKNYLNSRENSQPYCAREILTCSPPRVFVMGKALLIFGMFRFCSK